MENLELLTKLQLATDLRVSKRTIEQWCTWGILPLPTYLGRRAYWTRPVVEEWKHQHFDKALKAPVPAVTQTGGMRSRVKRHLGAPDPASQASNA